jgi:hypothetical protein
VKTETLLLAVAVGAIVYLVAKPPEVVYAPPPSASPSNDPWGGLVADIARAFSIGIQAFKPVQAG